MGFFGTLLPAPLATGPKDADDIARARLGREDDAGREKKIDNASPCSFVKNGA